MKLGAVLKKERERKELTVQDTASKLALPASTYEELESGQSALEDLAPKLAEIANKLATPTARLIRNSSKAADAVPDHRQCGQLIRAHREKRGLTREALAAQLRL